MTITEQFNQIDKQIDNLIEQKVNEYKQYTKIYQRKWYTGEPSGYEVWNVEEIRFTIPIRSEGFDRPVINKRATKQHVETAKLYLKCLREHGEIIFHCNRKLEYGTSSTGIWLHQIDNDHYSFILEGLQAAIDKQNEDYEKYYKSREGYEPCEYCRKQVPIDKVVKEKIYYIGIDMFGHKRSLTREGHYCSGQCAFNAQCAAEG